MPPGDAVLVLTAGYRLGTWLELDLREIYVDEATWGAAQQGVAASHVAQQAHVGGVERPLYLQLSDGVLAVADFRGESAWLLYGHVPHPCRKQQGAESQGGGCQQAVR